jgi:2-dehydropantoate 2-reductase
MRTCIIGAGAMGSLYGGLLRDSGADVILYDGWREHVEAIRRNGLHLDGITGDRHIKIDATRSPADIGAVELCIVQVNAYATRDAARIAKSCLTPDGYCITLQNGVGNVETLVEKLGKERVLAGLSYHSAALLGPGHARHTHAAETWLGELDGSTTTRLTGMADMMARAGFKPVIIDNIISFIWGKFIHNCAINPICAIARLRVGELALYDSANEFQDRILEEILAVMKAKNVVLPEHDPIGKIKNFCKVKFNKPSMLQHVELGRKTEIDALNGVIVSEGRRLGIPTPYNDALVLLLRASNARSEANANSPLNYDTLEQQKKREIETIEQHL